MPAVQASCHEDDGVGQGNLNIL